MTVSSQASPVNFSVAQRAVHWLTVLLIIWQFIAASGFDMADEAKKAGEALSGFAVFLMQSHFLAGFAILFFAVVRLILRFTQGVPAEPDVEPLPFRMAAKVVHVGLYVVLFAMPLSGIAMKYLGVGAAHAPHVGWLKAIMIVLIALHVLGALAHQFFWKTDVLARMTRGV